MKNYYILDIETIGIDDPDKFLLGCIISSKTPKKGNFFTTPEDMRMFLKRKCEQAQKRNKNVVVYAHYHKFDFYRYKPYLAGNAEIKTQNMAPFYVVIDMIENRTKEMKGGYLYLLDSYACIPTSLKVIGQSLKFEKKEMPDFLKDETGSVHPLMANIVKEYCLRDCQVLHKALEELTNICEMLEIKTRRYITIGQLSMNHMLNMVQKAPYKDKLLSPEKSLPTFIHPSKNALKTLMDACRGGRNEAFKTGYYRNVFSIDINNMYSKAAIDMYPFPDLSTETIINMPNNEMYGDIIKEIGASDCLLTLDKNIDIGIIPVRTHKDNTYYPKHPCILKGSWTHLELQYAVERGYRIHKIYRSVIYKPLTTTKDGKEFYVNPLDIIMRKLYNMRLAYPKGTFQNIVLKALQNHMTGKFKQTNKLKSYIFDTTNKMIELGNKRFNPVNEIDGMIVYEKTAVTEVHPRWFCPIIYAYITAQGRLTITEDMEKIGSQHLLYVDTDGYHMTIDPLLHDASKRFKYDANLGSYKIVHQNTDALIYRKKSYRVGEDMHLSGAHKNELDKLDFDSGVVHFHKEKHFKQAKRLHELGRRQEHTRDLKQSEKDFRDLMTQLQNMDIFIDRNTDREFSRSLYNDYKEALIHVNSNKHH